MISANIFFFLISFFVTLLLYLVNSYYLKPFLANDSSIFSHFMRGYFNDFWAGMFVVILSNFLAILVKKKYVKHILFYIVLWIFESFIWEIARPYILMTVNPLNKIPTASWGDVLAYGAGTFIAYAIYVLFNWILERKEIKHDGA